MSQELVIDNVLFARQSRTLNGKLPLSGFVRLQDQLEPDAAGKFVGDLEYEVTGMSGKDHEPLLGLVVRGDLVLRCQRCLKALPFYLEIEQAFEIQQGLGDDALTQEDLEDDVRDYLPEDRSMNVVALIEEEVLLSLPLVACHTHCELPDQDHDPKPASPFGVLLGLKKQSGKTH